jgi:hypothetical protein
MIIFSFLCYTIYDADKYQWNLYNFDLVNGHLCFTIIYIYIYIYIFFGI